MISLFAIPPDALLLNGGLNWWLVMLSLTVAIFSSVIAMLTVGIKQTSTGPVQRNINLLSSAVSLGVGIWAMHFIGMQAFELCTTVTYSPTITLLSLLPSIMASWVAVNLIAVQHLSWWRLTSSATLIALGIGSMHYSGMAAMTMAVQLRYDLGFFILSLLAALLLAWLALFARFKLQSVYFTAKPFHLNLFSGVILGLAISAMHYIGMAAARFVAPPGFVAETDVANSGFISIVVTVITIAVTLLVILFQALLKFRQASLEAKSYAERLSNMMNTALDAIITFNDAGQVVICNPAAEQLLQYNEHELKQFHFSALLPEQYSRQFATYLSEHKQTGVSQVSGTTLQISIKRRDGQELPVRLALSHVQIHGKDFYNAFLYDISEQLALQQSLLQSEQKLRSLIDNIPGAAYRSLIDQDWSMVFISEAVEELCGYPASDFILPHATRSWASLIHPDDQAFIASLDYSQAFNAEYRILHRNGSVRWMLEYGRTVFNAKQEPFALDGFIMDITERRLMEEQLRQAMAETKQVSELKSAFLANMSHEIRTPMNAIIGFTDLLLENPNSPDANRYMQTVNHSAKSLLNLLNDILDSAKLEKGKLELEQVHFNLTELVDYVVSTLWVNARNKKLDLKLNMAPELAPFYFGAAERIRQVLLNIVGNAIKFTEKGSVTVSVQPRQDQICFEIADTGIGIAPERLEKIFDPFTQADASMSRRFGGTGLGTTISKQLVELMGGTISVSSSLGQGSVFTICLPLAPGEAVAQEHKTLKLPPLRILIADDIPQNLELLQAILQRDQHQVFTATQGEEVLAALQTQAFDVVLLDIQMPVMDGLTAAKLRRDYEKAQQLTPTPIVALTASALAEDRQAVYAVGMNGFATKPVDPNALFTEIARVLKLPLSPRDTADKSDQTLLINWQQGTQLWGSKEKFQQELLRFAREPLQHLCEAILTAECMPELSTLKQRVHSYKGLAGNLALSALAASLSDIETEIASADNSKISQAVKACCQQVEKTRVAIAQLVPQPLPTQAATAPASLLPLLNTLQQQLQHYTFDDALLEALRQHIPHNTDNRLSDLIDATEAFAFAEASELVTQLIQELG